MGKAKCGGCTTHSKSVLMMICKKTFARTISQTLISLILRNAIAKSAKESVIFLMNYTTISHTPVPIH
ncbi:MAG: hypothetical protein EBZ53_05630 [Verrucomicrobia bacterium]|nr:hypothetical protein [Verrucomicrobiota bacterium]